MNKNTLHLVRNTIFTITAAFAAVIITLPSGAKDLNQQDKYGPLVNDPATYNPAFVKQDTSGSRYRLNPAFKPQPELQPRTIFSVSFDQKSFLPLAKGLNTNLQKRHDIVFDRDRSLIADYRLGSGK